MIRLEHTTNGHYKFYELYLTRVTSGAWRVTGVYGRIGTEGTKTIVCETRSKDAAETARTRKKYEKLDKGYRLVKDTTSMSAEEIARLAASTPLMPPEVAKRLAPKPKPTTKVVVKTTITRQFDIED